MASVLGARDLLKLVRTGIDVRAVQAHTRRPFRFLLCGDPALIAEMRALLLSGHDDAVPLDAAACLETVVPGATSVGEPDANPGNDLSRTAGGLGGRRSRLAQALEGAGARAYRRRRGSAKRPRVTAGSRHVGRIRRSGDRARTAARPRLSAPRGMRSRRGDCRGPAPPPVARGGGRQAHARRGRQCAQGRSCERRR